MFFSSSAQESVGGSYQDHGFARSVVARANTIGVYQGDSTAQQAAERVNGVFGSLGMDHLVQVTAPGSAPHSIVPEATAKFASFAIRDEAIAPQEASLEPAHVVGGVVVEAAFGARPDAGISAAA